MNEFSKGNTLRFKIQKKSGEINVEIVSVFFNKLKIVLNMLPQK